MRAVLAMTAAVVSMCLTAGAVQADAPLAGHWQLDEAAGTVTVDAVTGATGLLSGDVVFGPGKSGSGAVLNGGTVTGPLAVDTGSSFAVSAWVNLSAPCTARTCKFTAVSGDGERSSRFSLGYTKNRDLLGNWTFEVTESDIDSAPVTSAATSALPADSGEWTHLVGVYDAENQQARLYVTGGLTGEGRVNTQWSGPGGFTVGAARKAGVTTAFFPGAVDEVRFHGSALNSDEVFELYRGEA